MKKIITQILKYIFSQTLGLCSLLRAGLSRAVALAKGSSKTVFQNLLPFLVIAFVGLFAFNWFKGNYVIDTMDFAFPYDRIYFFKKLFFVWNNFNNLGFLDTRILSFLMPYGIYNFVVEVIGLTISQGQKLFAFFMFAGSGLSAYYFSRQLKFDKKVSLASALFYMINPFSMAFVWPMRDLLIISYAFMPLAIGHFIKLCELGEINIASYLKHSLLVFVLLTSAFSNPVTFLFYLSAICLYAILCVIKQKKYDALNLFIGVIATLSILSAFWMIPFFQSFKAEFSNAVGKIQQTDDSFVMNNNSESALESFSFTGYWMLFSEYKGDYYYPWYEKFQTNFGTLLKYLPLLFLISYFIFGKNGKTKIYLMCFVFVGIFFLTGNKNILPEIKMSLFGRMPFLLRAFRNLETKFYPVLFLGIAPVVGAGIFVVLEKARAIFANSRRRKIIAESVLSSLLLFYVFYLSLPVFTGEVIYGGGKVMPSFRVQIPEYYNQAKKWLAEQKDEFKIIALPLPTTYLQAFKWKSGFEGTSPDDTLFGKPVLLNNAGTNYIIPFSVSQFQEKTEQNSRKMARIAGLANVKYLVFHNDAAWEFMKGNDYWVNTLPEFFSSMEKYSEVKKIGEVSLVKVPTEYLNPLIYVPEKIISYNGDQFKTLDAYSDDFFYAPHAVLFDDVANKNKIAIAPDAKMKILWGDYKTTNNYLSGEDIFGDIEESDQDDIYIKNILRGGKNNKTWLRLGEAGTENLFPLPQTVNLVDNGSFEMGLWQEDVGDCSISKEGEPKIRMSWESSGLDKGTALRLDSENHNACVSQNIFAYEPNKDYSVVVYYKNISGDNPDACVWEKESRKCLFFDKMEEKNTTDAGSGWRRWVKVFHSGETKTDAYLFLYTDFKYKQSVNLFDNIEIKKLPLSLDNSVVVYRELNESAKKDAAKTKIAFDKKNPTLYSVTAKNIRDGQFIVFGESFHEGWRLSLLQKPLQTGMFSSLGRLFGLNSSINVNEKNHLVVNGYANAWKFDADNLCGFDGLTTSSKKSFCKKNNDGTYDINAVMEFLPQRWFYFGSFISVVSLLMSGWCLVKEFQGRTLRP